MISRDDLSKLALRLRPLLGAVTLIAAAFIVDEELLGANWRQVNLAFDHIPLSAVLMAVAATVAALAAASTYDLWVLRALGRPATWRRTARVSALSVALSQGGALGAAAALTLRRKIYDDPVAPLDIEHLKRWTGAVGVAGGFALLATGLAAAAAGPRLALLSLGFIGLAGAALYLGAPRRGVLAELTPPRAGAVRQLCASTLEWVFGALALYAVLPAPSRGPLLAFLPIYAAARLLGSASSLPGGLGVFEAACLVAFARIPPHQLAASLVVYRLIYTVAPLVLAASRIVLAAAPNPFRGESPSARLGREAVSAVLPGVLAILVFVSGVVMLASAATPEVASRIHISAAFAPLVVIETSHFIDSLIGALLLFLAFGLNNRMRKAWRATVVLLAVGAVSTMLRGLNVEEAGFLSLVALLLAIGRGAFYRTSPLRTSPLTPGMILSIGAAMAAVSWLGFFAFRHVDYRDELWWTFVADQGAPRLLRASVGVATLTLAVIAWRLIRSRAPARAPTDPTVLGRAQAALQAAQSPSPEANLAFLGDKQFLFSPSGSSFIQYATRGRTWVALGEPVGLACERRAMIWAFRELCDRHGAQAVFYAIRRESLADFVDCGLVAAKVGENAVVDLDEFTLTGRARQDLRTARNRAEREAMTFQVLAPDEVAARLDELQSLSDAWLERHQGEEKGFSLGRFEPSYVQRFDCAVMMREGRILAFTNLLRTPDGRRMAIDLMRYAPDAPPGTMEALLVETLLWAKEQGFATCDLGGTPLAGLESHRLANFMTRLGALIYTHAGRLYGFDGLRRFKAKFFPRWESVYIAAPTGWRLPSALGDAALLSSGGMRGLFRKEGAAAQKKRPRPWARPVIGRKRP